MRIPPLYQDKSWQRFFAGIFIGLIIGWGFFIYHFGLIHEKLVMEINKQKKTIEMQEETIKNLQESQDVQTEEMKKSVTVQEIEIIFLNEKEVKLSELTLHQLRSSVESDLEELRTKNIDDVAKVEDILIKAVENKTYGVGDKRYRLVVRQLIIYTTVTLKLKIELANE